MAQWDFAWKKFNMGDKLARSANLSPIFTTYHGNSQRLLKIQARMVMINAVKKR